jgi:leucyl aminopeptidase
MFYRDLACLGEGEARELHAIRPSALEAWFADLKPSQAGFLRDSGFAARQGQVGLLPGETGLAGAVLGLGEAEGPHVFGGLAATLPAGLWRLGETVESPADAVLGFCLGAYRFDALKTGQAPAPARLVLPPGAACRAAAQAARATWLVRDLINTPANLLGPAELADAARSLLSRNGGHVNVITGANLAVSYPTVYAVGRASSRPPVVTVAKWQNAACGPDAPLVSICGKGVCFDTGGYNLKPSAGMLRMKKDMGGAAIALALGCMIMEADLPCRLEVRLGCADNMISGDALRPLDVLTTRKGLNVEVGNTDAEGRLILCDLLAEACEAAPALLLDFATLTGAARVALGPDLAALFSNDDLLADSLAVAGRRVHDFVWRLPLWDGYNYWLESDAADLNNVTEKSHAGAVIAALFLQRFVSVGTAWAHFDVYGWNDSGRPGRPAGGEAQGLRAAFAGVSRFVESRASG